MASVGVRAILFSVTVYSLCFKLKNAFVEEMLEAEYIAGNQMRILTFLPLVFSDRSISLVGAKVVFILVMVLDLNLSFNC